MMSYGRRVAARLCLNVTIQGMGFWVMSNTYLIMPDIAAYPIRNGYFPYKAQ